MDLRIDPVTNGGVDPIYEMVIKATNSEGNSSLIYRWNNAPTGMLSLTERGMDDYRFSTISTANGTGGGFIWSGSGTLNVSEPCLSVNGPNVNAEFIVYGSNQTGVSLQLLYSKEGENTTDRGTIISTTEGSITANTVTGLVADGITKVVVEWTAVLDGIVGGDHPKVSARVFIP